MQTFQIHPLPVLALILLGVAILLTMGLNTMPLMSNSRVVLTFTGLMLLFGGIQVL